VSRGQATVTWPAATDADGESLTYTLQHRDADDLDWTTIASGMRGGSYSFSSTWPEPQGTWTYRVFASDAATDGAPSQVSAPAIVDRTAPRAPIVSADRPPQVADGAWFADTVTLGFAGAGDPPLLDGSPGSGVDPASLPAAQAFTAAGPHTLSGTVTDLAGNVSPAGSGTAQVDAAPPVAASSALAAGVPYLAGAWTNQPVTVHLACSDEGSGVAGADPDVVVSTEGAGQQVAQTCQDRVGHAGAATFGPVAIDRTPPSAPSQAVGAVVGEPVTLTAGVSDAPGGSGVADDAIAWTEPGSPATTGPSATYTFTAAGTRSITLAFRDRAGNTGSAIVTVIVRKPATLTARAGDVLARIPLAAPRVAARARVIRLRLTASAARTVRAALYHRGGTRAVAVRRLAIPAHATRTSELRLPPSAGPGRYVVRLTVFHGARRVGRAISATVVVGPS
jgi:hypothetical protein